MRGPVALVGSGEYLPVLEQVEAALIAGRPPRFVQLATAAAPEGQASLARWHDLGLDSARRLGVEQVVLPVVDRVSADDDALASLVEGAGLVYLSGGNPPFLVSHALLASPSCRAVKRRRIIAARGGPRQGSSVAAGRATHPRY